MADENANNNANETTAIDYEKLASILDGRMKATEDSVLKGYFKQHGLSEQEMAEAIDAFKKDKAEKTPDVASLNEQIAQATKRALDAEIELKASLMATELGVPTAKMPYLLKMADMGKAVKDGKIDKTKLKESLEAVLKDVPELKSQESNNSTGIKIGASAGDQAGTPDINAELARAFGVKAK